MMKFYFLEQNNAMLGCSDLLAGLQTTRDQLGVLVGEGRTGVAMYKGEG